MAKAKKIVKEAEETAKEAMNIVNKTNKMAENVTDPTMKEYITKTMR